jgi:predicted DNA-binding protein (MmcQ/YjbR family)
MNKNHWITILLDGSAEDSLIREMTEISFDLTNTGTRARSSK